MSILHSHNQAPFETEVPALPSSPVSAVHVRELLPVTNFDNSDLSFPGARNGIESDIEKECSDQPYSTASLEAISYLGHTRLLYHRPLERMTAAEIREAGFDRYIDTSRFEGQVVADLGCAHRTTAFLLCSAFGAAGYIGVDKFGNLEFLQSKMTRAGRDGQVLEPIKVATHRADMLSFLRTLPPRSLSFITGGIDEAIIQSDRKRLEILEEIGRCTHPDGCWLTFNSAMIPDERSPLHRVDTFSGWIDFSDRLCSGQFAVR